MVISSKIIKRILISIGLLSIAVVVFVVWTNAAIGKKIDEYQGVAVYDNGINFAKSYGKHFSEDGYYYGQKWQCVEFVKRFYKLAKNHQMPYVWGHAKHFFDESLADGDLNRDRNMVQYRNGSKTKPQADDLLVFTDSSYGHVGIVTHVSQNSVEIIQQNIYGKTRQTFELIIVDGRYFISQPKSPAGWLRVIPKSNIPTG